MKHTFDLTDNSRGRIFEGIGALSAGASSRLLYDYPEPYRSDILDYLFKPGFGASLHHLKVEIGGDVMSTDGSEPSHARNQEEMLNPKPEYFNRGYEWWLMKEAKKRNPDIILEALQWGAPGWIGNGNIYSQDNADFVAAFVKGAKTYHNLTVDYVGIVNEKMYEKEYVKVLRRTLDLNGLQAVKIGAADLWRLKEKWAIADDMLSDPEIHDAVAVIIVHVAEMENNITPPNARLLNVPIWNGEAHAYGGDWPAAALHAKINLRAYPAGKITKIVSWSLISSYFDFLLCPGSGMMKACSPWTGYYEVQPPVWIIAHTNQFSRPGWHFIESGCDQDSVSHWAVNTIQDSVTGNYSIIIETVDSEEDLELAFSLSGSFRTDELNVWRSGKDEQFVNEKVIKPVNDQFIFKAQPGSVYSITTTKGQMKGLAGTPVPSDKSFPIPYHDDFNSYQTGSQPKYLSDLHGCFEIVKIRGGKNKCLKQCITRPGINWMRFKYPMSILGDIKWKNYRFACDYMIPDTGYAAFRIRTNQLNTWSTNYPGYEFKIYHDGKWSLTEEEIIPEPKPGTVKKVLASGTVKTNRKNAWNHIIMETKGDQIGVTLNNRRLISVTDSTSSEGIPAIGTGWNVVYFDNMKIEKND
jgi:galactosylceramidase